MLKKLEDTYTVSDLSADQCPMKRIVQQAFVKLHKEQRLELKANKKKSLIDFVASNSAMVTKAAARENIQHGFIANGLVDDKFKRYPDFNKMRSTCRRNPENEDYNRCIETSTYLFDRCLEHGHVPDLEYIFLRNEGNKSPQF